MAFSALWRSLLRAIVLIVILTTSLPERAFAFDVTGSFQSFNTLQIGTCSVVLYYTPDLSDGVAEITVYDSGYNTRFRPGNSSFYGAYGGYIHDASGQDVAQTDVLASTCGVTVAEVQTYPIPSDTTGNQFSDLTAFGFVLEATESDGVTYRYTAMIEGASDTVITYTKVALSEAIQLNLSDMQPQQASGGETVTVTGNPGYNGELADLTYSWTQLSGPEVALTGTDLATVSFTAPTLDWDAPSNEIVLQLTVNGAYNTTATGTVTITVAKSDPPVLSAEISGSTTFTSGETVELSAVLTGNVGEVPGYEWSVAYADNPMNTLGMFLDPTLSFMAPNVEVETDLIVHLTYSETVGDEARSTSAMYTITILPAAISTSPELTVVIPSSETVSAGEEITFTTGIDGTADGEVSYAWTVRESSAEEAITLTSTTSTASFTAPTVAEDESWTVTAYLLIDGEEVDSRSTFFTVLANDSTPVEEETEEAEIVAEVEEQVETQAETQLTQIIANQPILDITIIDGNADLTMSSMGGTADLFTGFSGPVWAQLRADWTMLDGVKSGFVLGSLGTHWQVGDRTFLGLMLQADQMESDGITSVGWLVGPYAVYSLPDQPVTLQARFLAGAALNTLADGSEYASDRTITQFGLSGKVDRGEVQIQPSLKLTYGRSLSEAFTNAAGLSIAAQEATLAQAESGVSISFPVQVASGSLRLSAGLSDVWADTSDASSLNGHRGKLSFGGRRVFASGAALSFQLVQDGIGAPDYESTSATVNFGFDF